MIIDVHAHVFPDHRGASGYRDSKTHLEAQQAFVHNFWGRMISSTLDDKYKPYPKEEIGFKVGEYGRYYWIKNDRECWLQRFPPMMAEMQWSPEQMIAFMDTVGVDMAVLQTGYMENNFCRSYFSDIVKRWPDRFIGTVTIDYDIEKSEEYKKGELRKLRDSIVHYGMRGVFQGYPRGQHCEDERFDPLWKVMSELRVPHFFWTGFMEKGPYLESLQGIVATLKRFPDLIGIIGHLGGNVRHPDNPNFTDTPAELFDFLRLPNAYFEIGYVLAYENWDVWKENYEYPYPLHTNLIRRVYQEVGAERLLFGSDMPNIFRTCTYRQCLDLVRLHFDFLSEEEKGFVLGANAARIFRI